MHADGGHLVSKLVKCLMGPETHTWEIQVEWIGLDPLEASWEPATIIYEDVPEFVKRFVLRANSDAAQAMWASLTKTPAARQKSKPQRRKGVVIWLRHPITGNHRTPALPTQQ
ncbi:hypothetical protein PR002_g33089 [Phytophthora rubi]|uniref:Chromo domain-containing protein n=1 Tax=Phytophthora rubi TaxID=129364 RepID=A0A6A3G0U9_9STRA|nr:hypothetical protein PR002_g33089 [Phytophthora rubi]